MRWYIPDGYCQLTQFTPSFIYFLAIHLANSTLWVDAYKDLQTLKPGDSITLSVLDFFLSWESYQSQHSDDSASFYYINTETIKNLTGDPSHDHALVQKCLDLTTQPINHVPVIFLVSFEKRTYFLALFDFSENKVLILGCLGSPTLEPVASHAEWESWDGPILWERIVNAFTWQASKMKKAGHRAVVYEANWIPIFLYIIL
jgi:hypothetical protein